MSIEISVTAIQELLQALQESALTAAPPTNLPTTLPLAWPSDLHQLNFLTVLHLSHTIISQPQHAALLAEIGERPTDVALRGCLGLFLASEAGWDASNYLSARAWREDKLDEARVAEYFGITILRERQHESMPITMGERFGPAVELVADLCALFHSLGEELNDSCIGEEVAALLNTTKEHTENEMAPAFAFAKDFGRRVTELLPLLNDLYPDPPGDVLPAVPLRLLQDLSHVFGPSNAKYPLPPLSELANVSPLPLPPAVLLHFGVLQPEGIAGGTELRHATGDWWTGSKPEALFGPAPPQPAADDANATQRPPKIVKVERTTLTALGAGSVRACADITGHARTGTVEWQRKLTALDVSRVCAWLDECLDKHGQGVRIVL